MPGYNDAPDELARLKEVIVKIAPDSVQLNTLDRPGTVSNLKPASPEELQRIVDDWNLSNVMIIAASKERKKSQSYRTDVETAIMETISRRPCTLDDLANITGLHVNEINKYLDVLSGAGTIETVEQERGVFYQVPGGRG